MWIWIIIGIIVVAGLIFWVRSSKKGEGENGESMTVPEEPQAPQAETPSASEMGDEETKDDVSVEPSAPTESAEAPTEEEKPM